MLAAGTLRASSGSRLHYYPPWWVQIVLCPSQIDVWFPVDVLWYQKYYTHPSKMRMGVTPPIDSYRCIQQNVPPFFSYLP